MRISYLLACGALTLSAATLGAQKPKKETPKKTNPDKKEVCNESERGRVECKIYDRLGDSERSRVFRKFAEVDSAAMRRAALGMQLSATGSLRDTIGVFVSRVTPKGPAENAGIVEGDRIVSINGVDLRLAAADIDDGYTSGLPSHRLTREVQKLTPGSRVNLRVYSGGRIRDVQVVAGRASDVFKNERGFGFGFGGPGMIWQGAPGDMKIFRGGPGPHVRIFRDGMPMELDELPLLNKKLQELRAMPKMKMDGVEKMRLMEPKLEEMRAKLRSLEGVRFPSLEPLLKMQPVLPGRIDPWTIRILEEAPARATTARDT